jgi:hypothetical protein
MALDSVPFIAAASYDAVGTLAAHEQKLFSILPFCLLGFIGGYLQYAGAIKIGFQHKTHGLPLGCNLWFLAHDTTFVAYYSYWFFELDHWLMKAFWGGLLVFSILEMAVIFQILKYSKKELFPGLTPALATAAFLVCQATAYIAFWWFHQIIQDPLYLISFMSTVLLSPVLQIPMMLSRGSRRGISLITLIGHCCLAAGFYLWVFQVDSYFTNPLVVSVGVANMLLALATVYLYFKLPAYNPQATG